MFCRLFDGCSKLKSAKDLILSPIFITEACYYRMFRDCKNLTDAPSFSAVNLADYCYSEMFLNCTSLVNVPTIIPGKDLGAYCCEKMF